MSIVVLKLYVLKPYATQRPQLSRSGDGLSGPITTREFPSHQSFAKADMSSSKKSKTPTAPQLSEQEVQQTYSRFQSELQNLASKVGELEQEAEEHVLVLSTLNEALAEEPDRKCFRLIGGVLVERTVKDVVPALQTNREGIRKVIASLTEQYKAKEGELEKFKGEYNIRPAGRV